MRFGIRKAHRSDVAFSHRDYRPRQCGTGKRQRNRAYDASGKMASKQAVDGGAREAQNRN